MRPNFSSTGRVTPFSRRDAQFASGASFEARRPFASVSARRFSAKGAPCFFSSAAR
jgi:hypothetical protein